ncbi:2-oxoacid:acceptor oxidoreductase family protein [Acetonema longum]|uniref:Putative oxidoreductase subunit n=1 Tax=Acetonema longum DSM 6540 TaxID=1009370 RepID=F7NKL1_9FIRM|nr:2-oxoacid:acceptor oxidoreductase family protein [Acetonema longum]EGO63419.1 putative oxidoreductase subunit [Acetonema longum DSM 6540]
MKTEIICAGFGGQGVLTTGLIIARNCAKSGKGVTWIPSYGPEMRGGTANCHIKISNEEIFSPYVKEADVVIALNEASVNTFEKKLKSNGFLFVNSSIVPADRVYRKDINVLLVPMTEMANEASNVKGSNLVMLGAFVKKTNIFDKEAFRNGIDDFFGSKGKINPANAVCFNLGWDYAQSC